MINHLIYGIGNTYVSEIENANESTHIYSVVIIGSIFNRNIVCIFNFIIYY